MDKLAKLKKEILEKVKEYHNLKFGEKKKEFVEGETYAALVEDSLMKKKWLI